MAVKTAYRQVWRHYICQALDAVFKGLTDGVLNGRLIKK